MPGPIRPTRRKSRRWKNNLPRRSPPKMLTRLCSFTLRGGSLCVRHHSSAPVRAAAYRKDFEGFFATAAAGPMTNQISDLDITADGKLAFAHYTSHMVSTDKSGAKTEMVIRTTDCLKKIAGKWLIVQEHNSFPVDLASGKADLMSKP